MSKPTKCLHDGQGFASKRVAMKWALEHDSMIMGCPYCNLWLPNPGPSTKVVEQAHKIYRIELGAYK